MKKRELKREIDELRGQIELLKAEIAGLRSVVQPSTFIPTVFTPIDNCQHDYPNPWGGTIPPSCRKCGLPANIYPPYIITSQRTTGEAVGQSLTTCGAM